MILDSIFNMFIVFFNFVMNLLPSFAFLDSLIGLKVTVVNILVPFLSKALYFFNVPVLVVSIGILGVYLIFVFSEYGIKLALKYFFDILPL